MNRVVDTAYPNGDVPRHFTSDAFMNNKTEAVLRFYLTIFATHTGLTSKVFPLLAKTTQEHVVDETIIDVVPLVPHSHQALTAAMLNRSRRTTYRMVEHALSFSLDGSILNTSTGDFLASANVKALHSSVNLTMMINIMAELRKIPDFYKLYHKLLSITNVNRLEEDVATEAQRDLEERTIGFLDGQGAGLELAQNGITDPWHRVNASVDLFLRTADEVLHGLRVDGSLVPNFMIMSSSTARGIRVTSKIQDAPDPKSIKSINDFLHENSGDGELTLMPQIPQLGELRSGIAIVTIVPHYSQDGLVNELESSSTFGMFHPIHFSKQTPHVIKITVPDYAKRNNVELSLSTDYVTLPPGILHYHNGPATGASTGITQPMITAQSALNDAINTDTYHKLKTWVAAVLTKLSIPTASGGSSPEAKKYTWLQEFVMRYYNSWPVIHDKVVDADKLGIFADENQPFHRLQCTAGVYSVEDFRSRYSIHASKFNNIESIHTTKFMIQVICDLIAVTLLSTTNEYIMPPHITVTTTGGKRFDVPVVVSKELVHLVRPMIRINTDTIYYGIGGSETGNVLIGKSKVEEYKMPHNDRMEYRIQAMMAPAIYNPQHIIRVGDAKFLNYHSGADATVYGPNDCKGMHTFNSNPSNQRRHSSYVASSKNMIFMGIPEKIYPPNACVTYTASTSVLSTAPAYAEQRTDIDNLSHHQQFSGTMNYCVTGSSVGVPAMWVLGDTKEKGVLFGNRYMSFPNTTTFMFTNVAVEPTALPVTCWRKKLTTVTYTPNGDILNEIMARNNTVISRGPFRYVSVSTARDLWNGQAFTTCPVEATK